MAAFFERYDVLLGPTTQVLPFDVNVVLGAQHRRRCARNAISTGCELFAITVTGCPALSLPAGFSGAGLPIGMQLVAPVREDARLLGIAKAIENVTGYAKVAPAFMRICDG